MSLKQLKEMEKLTIEAALGRTDFNKTKAAEEVGISRKQLIEKIKGYQIRDMSANYQRLRHEVVQLQRAVTALQKQLAGLERRLDR